MDTFLRPPFHALESKLRPPLSVLPLVRRRSLLDALRACRAPLVLVCAAAGTGKTTLLTQWAEEAGLPTAWLQLEPADNDPVQFLTYLMLTVGRAVPLDPALPTLLALPIPTVDQVLAPAFASSVGEAPPFLLVIDDAHLVQSDTCWQTVAVLSASLPPGAHIAVGTRSDPPLPLGYLRAGGLLAEFGTKELALDRSEIEELLRLHGLVASHHAAEALLRSTEGWAAGAYLATLSQEALEGATSPADLRAGGREVTRYFASEVFGRQPEDRQDFLLRTSILRSLSPPLCRAVTGRDDSAAVLHRLAADNLFVSELGDDGMWFRYHLLFSTFLEAELARRAPDELPGLHRRAAAWYCAEGDIDRALHHWLAAGAVTEAAECVAANWAPYVLGGRLVTAASWLSSFSDEQILGHPALTLAAGWFHAMSGEARTGALWRRAETLPEVDGPSPDGAASLCSSRAMLRATLGQGGAGQMLRDAELAARLETQPGSSWHAAANLLLGASLVAMGRSQDAVAPLLVAAEESAAAYVLTEMGALGMLALIAADAGDWNGVRTYVDRAATCMADARMGTFCPSAVLHVARALVLARDGDPGTWDELARARDVLDHMVNPPSTSLLVSAVAGELCLRCDRSDEAEAWLARAQATLKGWPDAGVLRGRTDDLRMALDRRRGIEPLTPAEERVLELLPSQLSLAEIGERLSLSRNTVKTHAQHIYGKLGVSGRTPAIERARELGLLDD